MSIAAQFCLALSIAFLACGSASAQESEPDQAKPRISFVYSSDYVVSLGGLEKLHPFDISKFEKIYQRLNSEGLIAEDQVFRPKTVTTEQLELVHTTDYLENKLADRKNLIRYMEAPQALLYAPVDIQKGVLQPFQLATGGTILAAERALESGIGINLGGGFHHAKPDRGEGFCLYADIAIAVRWLQQQKKIKRAIVVDVDAHQGNGTIVCLADDPSVFTFSMHEGEIYPIPKERGSRDVELDAGTGDAEYMRLLKQHLPQVLDQAKADICLIVGGCDTLAGDPLTNLKMTHDGIVQRDAWIVEQCLKRKLPVVFTTSGGYSQDAWKAQYRSISNLIKTYGLVSAEEQARSESLLIPTMPELANELKTRVAKDQAMREQLIEATKQQGLGTLAIPKLAQDLAQVDQENTQWLKQQIDAHGWLGKSKVGVAGAHNAWLLVQHADKDPEFQQRCLTLMNEAADGEVAPTDIAYLTDRILVAAGKPQRYGTQCELIDGKAKVKECEAPDQLNQRRQAIGLAPIEEYLNQIESMYGQKK